MKMLKIDSCVSSPLYLRMKVFKKTHTHKWEMLNTVGVSCLMVLVKIIKLKYSANSARQSGGICNKYLL